MSAGVEEDIFNEGIKEALSDDSQRSDLAPVPRTPEDAAISHAVSEIAKTGGREAPRPPQQAPAQQQPQATDPQTGERVPLATLLDERERRQEIARQNQELQRQLQRYQQQEEAAKKPQTPIAQRLFESPEDVLNELRQEILEQSVRPLQTQLGQLQLQHDMSLASIRHQDVWGDAWQAWYGSVGQGQDPATYFRVMNAASPGEELVAWYKEKRMRDEIGDDPEAYKQKLREQILAEIQGGAQPAPAAPAPNGRLAPQQQVRLPTATSRMGNSNNQGALDEDLDGSEDAIFESARPRSRRDR